MLLGCSSPLLRLVQLEVKIRSSQALAAAAIAVVRAAAARAVVADVIARVLDSWPDYVSVSAMAAAVMAVAVVAGDATAIAEACLVVVTAAMVVQLLAAVHRLQLAANRLQLAMPVRLLLLAARAQVQLLQLTSRQPLPARTMQHRLKALPSVR